jgi:hypothetical protein
MPSFQVTRLYKKNRLENFIFPWILTAFLNLVFKAADVMQNYLPFTANDIGLLHFLSISKLSRMQK